MKDAYYFPHDSNAKDDPKCIMLIEELGLEGYGIFWTLIETLRDQPDYRAPLAMLPALARRYNSSGEKFKAVVSRYGLFQVADDEFFYSKSFSERMNAIDKRRKELSDAGRRGNAIRWRSGGDSGGDGLAIAIKGKEIKGKESKGKEIAGGHFVPPTYDEVYSIMRDPKQSQMFISFYESKGWKVGKVQMKDWRASVRGWMARNDMNPPPMSTREQFANYGDSI